MLFALLATACGGSDDAEPIAAVDDTSVADQGDSSVPDEGDSATSASSADDDDGAIVDEVTNEVVAPSLLEVAFAEDRDCAHSRAVLEGTGDVPLPPNEKPVVEEEYLGEFDELIVTDLIEGTGTVAEAGMTVTMQYVGVLGSDGTEFDASWNSGSPLSFPLGAGQVIVGWDEGIAGMKVGGRRLLQIPSAQAYGDQARSAIIVENSDLVFIVDLVGTIPPPQPAPPIDDSNLGSFDELQITDLAIGEGCTAETGDIARVHYVGVGAVDGEEFDSSWGRGETFEVIVGRSQVIEGWNAGIEGMRVGGERILQIPAAQAYNDGDLVFRVHLEELLEAPALHQIEFSGDAPTEVEITTLVEGSGDAVELGSVVDANLVIVLHNSNVIAQSSYQQGSPTQLAVQPNSLLPGLEEGLIGTQVGETRQIIIPIPLAYPDGIPEGSGLVADDAFVFIIEPLRITK